MKKWVGELIARPQRTAIPIMTHPGIELNGRTVLEAVTDGRVHYEAIESLHDKFPQAAAATVIMDLTVEAEAFGARLVFSDNEVPTVACPLVSDMAGVESLKVPDVSVSRVPQYLEANTLASRNIDKPVFAGCIGPFSLAGRLFDMTELMMAIYTEPELALTLLSKCSEFIHNYCREIKKTGVEGIIIAEPAAGLISNEHCSRYSSLYLQNIISDIQDDEFAVILHNCGNTGHCTQAMVETGAMGYHFGNKIDILSALDEVPGEYLVMGNLDPVSIFRQASESELRKSVTDILERTRNYENFVLSSGCDTPPGVPFGNIEAFYSELEVFNRQNY